MRSAKTREKWRYHPVEDHWDEATWRAGFPRRHWRQLMVSLGRMGFDQLSRRWRTGQQLIQTNGITYNVYGDPQGKERPWLMDPIPLVMDENEWAGIERAITQRATLLNAILGDLYGPRNLIRQRSLPAALLFANSNFLRACSGIVPPQGVYLHSYAADLARSPDGTWWVISDRTQAPSGVGYALENRLVSARTLPSVFNQCRVRQLYRFFDDQRDALMAMAPNQRSTPRVVLLTPGPHNETYFEHSFLARHWGFPLVEGADLTVRDNRVFLKTLAGLEPVDMILRRMDDNFCDPLELRGDSLLGIPGLVQAVRSGHVAIANSLGSGLMESAAHMAFLPVLSRELLGEELRMPSVATWWCGDAGPRRHVLENLENVVIKPAFPKAGQRVEFPATMSKPEREELAKRIEAEPEQFVAQEQVALSTAPVRTDHGIAARHVVLRVFAAWNGDGYSIMPGGLTRVSTEARSLVVSMQLGGGSKDTWVLTSADEHHASRAGHVQVTEPRRPGELPSRVADNLFWVGRYAERVEAGVRLVRSLLPALSSEEDFGRAASLETIVHLLSGMGYLPPETLNVSIAQQRWQAERLLGNMVYDPTRSSGIGWNLKQIRRVTWQLKERLSQDTWRVLQQLDRDFSSTPPATADQRLVTAMGLLDHAIVTLSAFGGLLMENTTRGYGWRFLDIGRRLERALQMTEMLKVGVAQGPFENEPYLDLLLQIADSSITYRTRYLTALRTEFVLELLLTDESNPRSVAFQLLTLLDHVENLPWQAVETEKPVEIEVAQRILQTVRTAQCEDLATRDALGNMGELEELLGRIKTDLYDLSDALTARYLSHLTISRLTSV
ncbi:MAG: circularly permuted type 2 ATP-grasp protein [Bryobacteraceae bacterium]